MQQREVEVGSPQGLNARASTRLVQVASSYLSDVSVSRGGRRVNAKSLMGVMMLAAGPGVRIVIEADGPDETAALEAIFALIGSGADA